MCVQGLVLYVRGNTITTSRLASNLPLAKMLGVNSPGTQQHQVILVLWQVIGIKFWFGCWQICQYLNLFFRSQGLHQYWRVWRDWRPLHEPLQKGQELHCWNNRVPLPLQLSGVQDRLEKDDQCWTIWPLGHFWFGGNYCGERVLQLPIWLSSVRFRGLPRSFYRIFLLSIVGHNQRPGYS